MNHLSTNEPETKKEFIKFKFIEAAKALIFQEGVAAVTARRLGEAAGYSYATVYHYFTDLGDLLLETKLSMIRDMVKLGQTVTIDSQDPLRRVKENTRIPVDFFIDNPNIFRFFYAYPLDERNETAMRSLDLEKNYYGGFLPFVETGVIKESDIPTLSRTLLYAVYGMITLYLSDNGLTREEIYRDMDNMIDLLLKGSE